MQYVLILYLIPALLSLLMFNYNSGLYPKLPDRIPIHFGLSGKPDRWAGKSRIWINIIPAMNVFVVACMYFSFTYLPMRESGPQGEYVMEAAAYGGGISLLTGWLLYMANKAMMDAAQGKDISIWPYIRLPMGAVIGASFAPLLLFAIPQHGRPVRAVMCAGVTEQYATIDEKDTFTAADEYATIWIKWRNLNGRHTVRYEWYAPDGELYYEYDYENKQKRREYRVTYSSINIAGYPPAETPGEWSVSVFLDDEFVIERKFEITGRPQSSAHGARRETAALSAP